MNKSTQTIQKDFSNYHAPVVGILSDTHGHINEDVQKQLSQCDVILHAGDIGSIQVILQLKEFSQDVIFVRGNNDVEGKWPSNEHSQLKTIADVAEVMLPGGTVVILHGDRYNPVAKRHEKLRQLYPDAKAIVYGHSHIMVCDMNKIPWVLNPGAAGLARTKGGASCLIMQTNNQQWKISEFRAVV